MKKVLLVAAALSGWATYAHASDAYSDPGEYRTPGVTVSTSSVKTRMADTFPYLMSAPGTAYGTNAVKTRMADTFPYLMSAPGSTYATSPSIAHAAVQGSPVITAR